MKPMTLLVKTQILCLAKVYAWALTSVESI